MRVYLDLSIYSSPAECLGNVTGAVETSRLPCVDEAFPWKNHLAEGDPLEIGRAFDSSVVTAVDDAEPHLFGTTLSVMADCVFSSEESARKFVALLRERFEMVFCEF